MCIELQLGLIENIIEVLCWNSICVEGKKNKINKIPNERIISLGLFISFEYLFSVRVIHPIIKVIRVNSCRMDYSQLGY